jgi:tryptophan synthase alpha chain
VTAAPAANAGAERIAGAFARRAGRAAVMPYFMAGFPSLESSVEVCHACADAGGDVLELGIPFSDPLADGPVIQAAGTAALRAGTTVDDVLRVAEQAAARMPVVLFGSAHLVFARGPERFAQLLAGAGCSGMIIPDLPLEEAPAVLEAYDAAGLALVPLVAPTTPPERMRAIAARARGFLYTVSVTGTTGERAAMADTFAATVAAAREHSPVPVALGFGIATPEHAVQAADAGADGVIIGSRLVRAAAEAGAAGAAAAVGEVVGAMAAALRDAR